MDSQVAIKMEHELLGEIRALPAEKQKEALGIIRGLKREQEDIRGLRLPGAVAAMVETGEIELSDRQDIGVGNEDQEPSITLEELRARLSEVSVPIEEYIRGERSRR